jgi:hypothetical protein
MEQRGRGQRRNAALKDARIKLKREECAIGMEQRGNDAAVMDAQTKLSVEESVGGTAQTAIHTMNLLHLGQSLIRLMQL